MNRNSSNSAGPSQYLFVLIFILMFNIIHVHSNDIFTKCQNYRYEFKSKSTFALLWCTRTKIIMMKHHHLPGCLRLLQPTYLGEQNWSAWKPWRPSPVSISSISFSETGEFREKATAPWYTQFFMVPQYSAIDHFQNIKTNLDPSHRSWSPCSSLRFSIPQNERDLGDH